MTILVVFKNALDHIEQCMTGLKNQSIDHLRILLIDDFSSDGGQDLVNNMGWKELVYHKATKDVAGKKIALQEGITLVNTDVVLLTDIDCVPASSSWARLMQEQFRQNIEIVLGYSPMIKAPGLVNVFARFETLMTAVQYMSYALAGIPYMGVGRNLAYRVSTASSYVPDTRMASGDDDLFVSAQATAYNTAISLEPDSFMLTQAKSTWRDFIKQKRRHISTSHHYSGVHKVLLSLFAMSQMLIIPLLIFILSIEGVENHLLVVFLMYIIVKWLIAFPLMKKFAESSLYLWFPILDVMLSAYYWLMAVLSLKPLKTWS